MRFSVVLAALSAATVAYAQSGAGDATFYTPGLGSCGHPNVETDFIAALDPTTMQNPANPNANPLCGRQVQVTGPDGRTVMVTVADTCPGCAPGSIDLTPAAFQQLASLDVGRLQGVSWTLL
ncbi:RlpA-like double-psi beta-barrel-protein domain-containing protein-containing protein [Fomes fomentarius]|nr:RlpA-like double-psi beta-barrel-protein domain-containing protein-containing protein [Fomes fomentarius]